MKFVVAGSRDLHNRDAIYKALDERRSGITEIVTGMALCWLWDRDPEVGGPDRYGHDWAVLNNVPFTKFPAIWDYKGAGFRRNEDMADYADAALIWWNGSSTGTQHMISEMNKRKKICIVEHPSLFEFE